MSDEQLEKLNHAGLIMEAERLKNEESVAVLSSRLGWSRAKYYRVVQESVPAHDIRHICTHMGIAMEDLIHACSLDFKDWLNRLNSESEEVQRGLLEQQAASRAAKPKAERKKKDKNAPLPGQIELFNLGNKADETEINLEF